MENGEKNDATEKNETPTKEENYSSLIEKAGNEINGFERKSELIDSELSQNEKSPETEEIREENRELTEEAEKLYDNFRENSEEKEEADIDTIVKFLNGHRLNEKEKEKMKKISDSEISTVRELFIDERFNEYEALKKEEKEEEIEKTSNKFTQDLQIEHGDMEKRKKELEEELEEKRKAYENLEGDFLKIISNNENILESEDRKSIEKTLKSMAELFKSELDLKKLDYVMAKIKNPDDLVKSHAIRKSTIEDLEKIAAVFEKDIEKMEEGERKLLEELFNFLKKHPELFLAGTALTAAAGATYALSKAALTAGVAEVGGKLPILGKKLFIPALKIAAAGGVVKGMGIFGVLLAGFLLTSEKQRDDLVELLTGRKVPSWARVKKGSDK